MTYKACKFFAIEFNKVLKKLDEEGLVEKNFDYERIERSSKTFKETYIKIVFFHHLYLILALERTLSNKYLNKTSLLA